MFMQFGQDFGTASQPAEPINLWPKNFPAQPGQLQPEAYKSQTPTVRTLSPKNIKNALPPQYKTNTLPPKVVSTTLQPIFSPRFCSICFTSILNNLIR